MVSSTAVTLNFSRQSRDANGSSLSLAGGVFAACTVLVPRVLLVSAVLNPTVALHLLPALAPMFLAGVALVVAAWRRSDSDAAPSDENTEESPLRLAAAIRMALLFQVAMIAIAVVRRFDGGAGLYTTAAVLGLTDADALTVSLSRPEAAIAASTAARAIVIGVIANTMVKLSIAMFVGRAPFRRRAVAGLACLAVGGAFGMIFV
jgi:uncharacterized membrane protein (DUF4010 family)